MSNSLSTTQLTLNEAHELYENGKHRLFPDVRGQWWRIRNRKAVDLNRAGQESF